MGGASLDAILRYLRRTDLQIAAPIQRPHRVLEDGNGGGDRVGDSGITLYLDYE